MLVPTLCADAGAVDLRNALASRFGVNLTATVVYDHPTIAALSKHIAGLLVAAQPKQATAAASPDANVDSQRQAAAEFARLPVVRGRSSRMITSDIVGIACRYPGGATSESILVCASTLSSALLTVR